MTGMAKARKQPSPDAQAKKPVRSGKPLNVWIGVDLRDALDAFIESTDPKTNVTATIESALKKLLQEKGFWPPAEQK